jgi:hypothetical protein
MIYYVIVGGAGYEGGFLHSMLSWEAMAVALPRVLDTVRPLWIGFIVNAVVYACAQWLVMSLAVRVERITRARRGRPPSAGRH